jgi:hypothetical protein
VQDSSQQWERVVTDFQLVLRAVGIIFVTCMILAVVVVGMDAFTHLPLADYLVKKFGDIMTLCVGALVGLLAGQKIESRKKLR